ncbi:MAG: serine/threonine-protein phosphatase, partial [Methanobrevibacter sp.]|nr:serine/threonine-protein phosphatase [Methanobrevibacter sp.]
GIEYETNTINLDIGDKILLYTDGVTEANNSYNEFFGEEKLKEIVEENDNLSVDECVENIKNRVLEFSGKDNQFDDITLLMVEYTGKKEKD